MSAFLLLSITLFSCTADEFETETKKTEIKKEVIPSGQASEPDPGPGDDPTNIKPPKK